MRYPVSERNAGCDIDPDDEPKTIPEQIEATRVKTPEEIELETQIEALRLVRIAKAGHEGTMEAKKTLFETQNKATIDALNLCKTTEIELTNKIRYLALKVHKASGRKKFADDKVTIKSFKVVTRDYDVPLVIAWAKENAPTFVKEVLDVPTFEAYLDNLGPSKLGFKAVIDMSYPKGGLVIATSKEYQEPRAQIKKVL